MKYLHNAIEKTLMRSRKIPPKIMLICYVELHPIMILALRPVSVICSYWVVIPLIHKTNQNRHKDVIDSQRTPSKILNVKRHLYR